MTSLSPAAPRLVLADRIVSRSLLTDVALVATGAVLTAVLAQVAIPMFPVPITGQTLAVLLVGATLGAARGALALGLYAVLGLVGLPVYSDFSSGWGVLAGPTGGYIIGFVVAAGLVGWLSERSWDRKFLKALLTFVLGTVTTFAIGLPWLALALGNLGLPNDLNSVLAGGLYPFLIGGAIKALIAAGLLPLAWFGADRLAERRARDAGQ